MYNLILLHQQNDYISIMLGIGYYIWNNIAINGVKKIAALSEKCEVLGLVGPAQSFDCRLLVTANTV